MILKDLRLIIESIESNYESYFRNPYEVVLSDTFKQKYRQATSLEMNFYEHTSIAVTSKGLKIIIPNQWFLIASFFLEYLEALSDYKNVVNKIGISKVIIEQCKSSGSIPVDIETEINSYFNDNVSRERLIKFLTDYEWWCGSKTIDRVDYYVSPILKIAKVVNNTQAYIADIGYDLTTELVNLLNSSNQGAVKSEFIRKQTIYYGAPGTGKSHTVKKMLKAVPKDNVETVTFHPDYDYVSFVGGYRPISEDSNIEYKFVPQVFTNLYVKSWQNPNEPFYLVIEEINRGNCAEIFGDIFQLLDQNQDYTVTPSSELESYLDNELSESHEGIIDGLKMPPNLSILATMNTSDQSLFPMDSAFKRRWDWEYIPISYNRDDENKSSKFIVDLDDGTYFSWLEFIEKVNIRIKSNPNLGMDKCIGNYFINPTDNTISLNTFINKAIFYLWNDVFKDEFGSNSIFAENVTYEDFFPVKDNGAKMVIALLETLNFKLSDGKYTVLNEDTN